jgi:NOL1/NOP2/fmu family ribosome biogenesis protein
MDKIIHAIPDGLASEIKYLLKKLQIINYGVKVGEIIRDKLVPDHALALSGIVSEKVNRIELDLEQAILYLKKRELNISLDNKGWAIVIYQGFSLGWVNVLQNRMNNYYPKELRILKQ